MKGQHKAKRFSKRDDRQRENYWAVRKALWLHRGETYLKPLPERGDLYWDINTHILFVATSPYKWERVGGECIKNQTVVS